MEYIELTNEEYDAVMEAREELESLEEFKSDIKRDYAVRRMVDRASHYHILDKDHKRMPKNYNNTEAELAVTNMDQKKLRDKANKYISKIAKYNNKFLDANSKKHLDDYKKYGKINDDNVKDTDFYKNMVKTKKYIGKLNDIKSKLK